MQSENGTAIRSFSNSYFLSIFSDNSSWFALDGVSDTRTSNWFIVDLANFKIRNAIDLKWNASFVEVVHDVISD